MPLIEVDGISLYYQTIGNGCHPILCLPGFLGTVEDAFGAIFKKINHEKFQLIAWDPPGYGKSRPPNREVKQGYLQKDAELAAKMMKNLGFGRYSILGISQGGETGLYIAAAYSCNVISIATMAVGAVYDENALKVTRSLSMVDYYPEKQLSSLLWVYERDYLKRLTAALLHYIKEISASGEEVLKDAIGKIKCPLLITHGQKDSTAPVYQAYETIKRFPQAKLHIFPDGNHDFNVTQPDEFVRVMFKFFGSTSV